jgi:hypothetical protein
MTKDPCRFYVYAYLRSKDSESGRKYSPYYIGKGQNNRAFSKNRLAPPPRDKSFIVFIQEGLTEEEAFKLEAYCISLYGRINISTGILRNLTDGGEGASGAKRSEEAVAKLCARMNSADHPFRGKNHSEETRRKMSENRRGSNNPRWNKPVSDEVREKISKANTGKKRSSDVKESISLALTGHKHSEETRQKIAEGNRGRVHSKASRQKMSKSREVHQYEFVSPDGTVYSSTNFTYFCEDHGINKGNFFQVIQGKKSHCKGWTGKIVQSFQ